MDLALFDLDETLISDDSTGLWIRWLVNEGLAPFELSEQEQTLMTQYYQGNCLWRVIWQRHCHR